MRTIYLRTKPGTENAWLYNPYYWKVVSAEEDKALVVQVTRDSFELSEGEDFFEEVSFIKNELSNGIGSEGVEEITRDQFDDFYKQTVFKLNSLTAA